MSNGKQTELKTLFNFIFVVLPLIALVSCDSNEPQTASTLSLTVEDVSCTEAWLQLKTANLNLPNRITLFVNDLKYQEYLINNADTLLYIDSLLPDKNYSFKAVCLYNAEDGVNSNKVVATTMDTTSNSFSWRSWSFGTISSSILYDIAIINENDVWAVGEIYVADSSINGYTTYNAVHWNGHQWELKKIQVFYPGTWITPELSGILAFSSSDIWLAGSLPIHGDGINWTIYDIRATVDPYLSASRVWGSNPDDIYFVGRLGSIVHYNGTTFSKIESGTTIAFQDVFGARNSKTNHLEILAIADENYPLEKFIYRIDGNTASKISTNPIEYELLSCWFVPGRHYYVVGSGIFEKNRLSENSWRNDPLEFTTHASFRIRGNALNNIFCVGGYGEILHFNGYRWKSFIPLLGTIYGNYGAVAVENNFVVIAGFEGIQAKITMGVKN